MTAPNSEPAGGSTLRQSLSALEAAARGAGRALADAHPVLGAPLERLWDAYILAHVYGVSRLHARQYAHHTTLDPLGVARVDPGRVTRTVEADGYPEQTRDDNVFPTPKFKHAGTVRAGDWDRGGVPVRETELYRSFRAHFQHGVPWPDTAFFQTVLDHLRDGVELWGCTTPGEFRERCERLDALYRDIDANGYKSQAELTDADDAVLAAEDSRLARFVRDEVTVCVGRDGDLLFLDGRNRLAIAILLGLDAIPVWILVRHRRWQQFRERVASGAVPRSSLPARLRDHPDLP